MYKKKKKEFKQLSVNPVVEPTVVTHFKRAAWKHWMRLLMLGVLVLLYSLFVFTSYHTHLVLHQGFNPKELLAYFLGLVIFVPVFPSVVMEADWVQLKPNGILIKNLLFKNEEAWEDIKSFADPIYLKFSILKGKKFVYLLNRRDLSDYDQLVEAIRDNAVQLAKVEGKSQ